MKHLTISNTTSGIRIKDSITDASVLYIGYSLEEAIKRHRRNFNLVGKHFVKLYY